MKTHPMQLHRTTETLDVNDADLSGSTFNDANLTGATFNQINFSGARFNDSNMTGWQVNDVNLAGSRFQNINLSGVSFSNCRLAGATLDGVPLEDMIEAYRKSQPRRKTMGKSPDIITAYITAYNDKDVDGMLDCLSDAIEFRHISGGVITAAASGRQDFADLARFGVAAFKTRHQDITNAITVADLTLAEISYTAVVAIDLPNGWTAGQDLAFTGASSFRVENGKIVSIVDES